MDRKIKAVCVTVSLVAASAALAPSAYAAADGDAGVTHAPCYTSPSDKDGSSWYATGYGANMRTGSSTSCGTTGVAGPGDILDYHCYTNGNDGYTWTYLRNDTDGTSGWVRDELLADNGSTVAC